MGKEAAATTPEDSLVQSLRTEGTVGSTADVGKVTAEGPTTRNESG